MSRHDAKDILEIVEHMMASSEGHGAIESAFSSRINSEGIPIVAVKLSKTFQYGVSSCL